METWRKLGLLACCLSLAGCGTTRATHTSRTATEQLLISDAIDRTVEQINFDEMRGGKVYLDERYLSGVVDRNYLVATLRHKLIASGCMLAASKEEAEYVVEARAGTIGTNNTELLLGIPAINVPVPILGAGIPSNIPEVPIVKRTDLRGVAKVAVVAYHRETGAPIWQSGNIRDQSTGKDVWVLGAGPFQWGSIHEKAAFAGAPLPKVLSLNSGQVAGGGQKVRLDEEVRFHQPLQPLPPLHTAQSQNSEQDEDDSTTTE